MNARLPGFRYSEVIGQMPIDDFGYTTPWAMWVDMDGECWINGKYNIYKNAGGTVAMMVIRTEEGYIVDISQGHAKDYNWSPSSEDNYVGGAEKLPVIEVIT